MPWVMCFCSTRNTSVTGSSVSTVMASSRFHDVVSSP